MELAWGKHWRVHYNVYYQSNFPSGTKASNPLLSTLERASGLKRGLHPSPLMMRLDHWSTMKGVNQLSKLSFNAPQVLLHPIQELRMDRARDKRRREKSPAFTESLPSSLPSSPILFKQIGSKSTGSCVLTGTAIQIISLRERERERLLQTQSIRSRVFPRIRS